MQLDPPFWTTEDDNALLLARRRRPDLTWAEIAALLPGNRSLSDCYNRYHSKSLLKKGTVPSRNPKGRPRKTPQPDSEARIVGQSSSNAIWTTQENDILKRNNAKGLSWEEVARLLPEKSWRECKQQYEKLQTTVKDTPTSSIPMSDARSPSPMPKNGAPIDWEVKQPQSDALCEPDEEEATSSTNPDEPMTKDMALTNNGHRKNRKRRYRDAPRWTEDDRRLVQSSYLLSLPRW